MQPVLPPWDRKLPPLTRMPPVSTARVGGVNYCGRCFFANERRGGILGDFMNDVTEGGDAQFGAVRNTTPIHGHKDISLQELHTGKQHVAAGSQRFIKAEFLTIGDQKKKTLDPVSEVKPVTHSKITAPSRFQETPPRPCIIYLIANGDLRGPAVRLMIPGRVLIQWEHILSIATEKMNIQNGVHRLYTLDGDQVESGRDLISGNYYVATGREKFKKLYYREIFPPTKTANGPSRSLSQLKVQATSVDYTHLVKPATEVTFYPRPPEKRRTRFPPIHPKLFLVGEKKVLHERDTKKTQVKVEKPPKEPAKDQLYNVIKYKLSNPAKISYTVSSKKH